MFEAPLIESLVLAISCISVMAMRRAASTRWRSFCPRSAWRMWPTSRSSGLPWSKSASRVRRQRMIPLPGRPTCLSNCFSALFYFLKVTYFHPTVSDNGCSSFKMKEGLSLSFSFQWLCLRTVLLPLVGFTFCLFWSLMFDFEKTTETHCEVAEILPSISSVIGKMWPRVYKSHSP